MATFVQNHAAEIIACDFFTSVTARFQVMYVFIAIEIGSRRILHVNVTIHRPQSGRDSSFVSSWTANLVIAM